jgi:NAD(P)-dependent dehydrogenase (short-subunit alcohol dehydrogenase family)
VSVAVVTGGAVGIGAAIAEELGRQGTFVVTVDPGVKVDGTPGEGGTEATTAERIIETGGQARASNLSVTDAAGMRELFAGLVDEFGSLDAVVNVAGISRPTSFAGGEEADWEAVLDVHLNGYLSVLGAALPIMAAARRGRVLGVTSGSGWRAADAGAYSCAKRAVAALTWQLGRVAPDGVTVNALSPIAATRMVLGALTRQAGAGNTSGKDAATGGLSLGAVPPPEHLGPIGAYLAGERFSAWSSGHIMFSNGAEVAHVVPPRLLEVARASSVGSFVHVLSEVAPKVFAPAEAAQLTAGGGNPRVGGAFGEPGSGQGVAGGALRVAVVSDVPAWATAVSAKLSERGAECVAIDQPASDFGASKQLSGVGDVDAVVLALGGGGASGDGTWQGVLAAHEGLTDRIRRDAAWVRAVADQAAAGNRNLRVVTLVDATTAGGHSRAQAAAQLSRAAHPGTGDQVDAFAVAVESSAADALAHAGELAGHLVVDAEAGALSGAEFAVGDDWVGLRSHPRPAGSITFGGPDVPDWVDGALRELVQG